MTRSLPPMITAQSLGSMPEFIISELGSSAIGRVMARSALPDRVLENRNLFIPESMLTSFLRNAAREVGDDHFGLLVAPHLTVADYGIWGEYVLGAPTLGSSLSRVLKAIRLHSNDAVGLTAVAPGVVRFAYDFGVRHTKGYGHIATCAVGVICSIFKHYAGPSWRPAAIDLDIPPGGRQDDFEKTFGCPVRFRKPSVAVWFHSQELSTKQLLDAGQRITIADVERSRFGGAPTTAKQKVWQLIMLQLLDGPSDIEDAARKIGVGVRRLQRSLQSEATSFRELANQAIVARSTELLSEPDLSITEIAFDLGYSTPSHFARAFRKQTGHSPGKFRQLGT